MNRFRTLLDSERAAADGHPRNRITDWANPRFERARVVAVLGGWEIIRSRRTARGRSKNDSPIVETRMSDASGNIAGTPDLVERDGQDLVVVDYKTGVASNQETKERQKRQLMAYAHIVESALGVLPTVGEIRYPGSNHRDRYDLHPDEIAQLVSEMISLAREIASSSSLDSIAVPGPACDSCPYTLWCEPFWDWQERPGSALEGDVVDVAVSEDSGYPGRSHGWITLQTEGGLRSIRVSSGPSELLDVSPRDRVRFVGLFEPEEHAVIAGRFTDALVLIA